MKFNSLALVLDYKCTMGVYNKDMYTITKEPQEICSKGSQLTTMDDTEIIRGDCYSKDCCRNAS